MRNLKLSLTEKELKEYENILDSATETLRLDSESGAVDRELREDYARYAAKLCELSIRLRKLLETPDLGEMVQGSVPCPLPGCGGGANADFQDDETFTAQCDDCGTTWEGDVEPLEREPPITRVKILQPGTLPKEDATA